MQELPKGQLPITLSWGRKKSLEVNIPSLASHRDIVQGQAAAALAHKITARLTKPRIRTMKILDRTTVRVLSTSKTRSVTVFFRPEKEGFRL